MSWAFIPTAITTLLAILTFLGVQKFFLEPWQVARQLRKKYATALWISCKELQLHLHQVRDKVLEKNTNAISALKKIPDNDFKGRSDWFTKHGYYTTITAYKIAVVSSWLCIYQQELLFSTYSESRALYPTSIKTSIVLNELSVRIPASGTTTSTLSVVNSWIVQRSLNLFHSAHFATVTSPTSPLESFMSSYICSFGSSLTGNTCQQSKKLARPWMS